MGEGAMARWGLLGIGGRQAPHYAMDVLEEVDGTREEALARLEVLVREELARRPKGLRTRMFRTADGFLLVTERMVHGHGVHFTVAELVHDTEDDRRAELEADAARRQERAERRARERAERRNRGEDGHR